MTRLAVSLPALLVLTTALLFAQASSAAQGAQAELPSGWHLEGPDLVWTSDAPLRMGGARYEFRSGTRLLGYPTASGRTLRLRLSPADPLTGLSVRASGRRLDADATAFRIPYALPPREPTAEVIGHDPAAPGRFDCGSSVFHDGFESGDMSFWG